MTPTLRIGTRGSALALVQARWAQAALQRLDPTCRVDLVIIKTSGDRFVDQPLSTLGGKGLFVKEIEEALRTGAVDLAVHSMKDVPTELASGLVIAAVPQRADPSDVLITRTGARLSTLRRGARIGTSSLRRMALLRAARSDLDIHPLRGNVDTRLRKLEAGDVDAIVLAAAGLGRLGLAPPHQERLPLDDFPPAIGQGALAIETRADAVRSFVAALDDAASRVAVTAERAFLDRVGGSCHTPLAAHATVDGDTVRLAALIASPDGSRIVRGARTGPRTGAADIGRAVGSELLAAGGFEILRALEDGSHAG